MRVSAYIPLNGPWVCNASSTKPSGIEHMLTKRMDIVARTRGNFHLKICLCVWFFPAKPLLFVPMKFWQSRFLW